MADRMIVMPPKLTARQKSTHPRLDYLFVFPDPFVDAKVRLVVYHLDQYRRSPLCAQEGANFVKFKKGDADLAVLDSSKVHPAHGTELDPKLGDGTGVLLKLDGTLQRSSKVKSPRGWWLSKRAEPAENTDKPFSIIRLHMPISEEDAISGRVGADAIARIILRDDGTNGLIADHKIVFRLALTHPHAGMAEGSVIASSLCPEHNPACVQQPPNNPHNTGFVLFDASAVEVGMPPTIGGPGTPPAQLPPTPNPRVLPFDLTGFYEHENLPKDPALIVQINQAGHSVIGWFSFPIITPEKASPIPGLPKAPGCFYVMPQEIRRADPDKGRPFNWIEQDENGLNTIDPDEILFRDDLRLGWIKRIPIPPGPTVFFEDRIQLIFEHADGSASPPILLGKVRNGARWPWIVIGDESLITKDEREALIVDQVRPIHVAALERLRQRLDPSTLLQQSPPKTLKDLIQEWRDAADGRARALVRGVISNHLRWLMSPFINFTGDYRRRAAEQLHVFASQFTVAVIATRLDPPDPADGAKNPIVKRVPITNTVLGWFKEMVAQYLAEVALKAGPNGPSIPLEQLYQGVEMGFKEAEIRPKGKFVYTLKFDKFGIPKVPVVKIYPFTVNIKKQIRQPGGSLVDDPNWFVPAKFKNLLLGSFIAGGVGFGFGVDGKKKAAKAKKTRGGSFPSEVVMESFADLRFEDFVGAWFSITAFEALQLDGVFDGHVSSMFELHLSSGVDMTTIVSETFEEGFKKGVPKGVTLAEVTKGIGRFETTQVDDEPPKDRSASILQPKPKDLRAQVHVFFAKDSATIPDADRSEFELRLAMYRPFFEVEQPKARVLGYTSPEGSKAHNLDLSRRRAAAVSTAVLDAFDSTMALVNLDVVGLGEDPAISRGGMLDPPGETAADRLQIHEDETSYLRWRIVDFLIANVLVVRVAAKDEKKGKSP